MDWPIRHVSTVDALRRRLNALNKAGLIGGGLASTDELPEGTTNLYFTNARAVSAIKADPDWNAGNWDTAYDRSPTSLDMDSADTLFLARQGLSSLQVNLAGLRTLAGGTANQIQVNNGSGGLAGVSAWNADYGTIPVNAFIDESTGYLVGLRSDNSLEVLASDGNVLLDGEAGVFDPRITFTRNSTATYFDSSGVLQTAAVDVARLDHDPSDNSVRGWLFEESRTNELLDNRDLSTGNWTEINAVSISQDETGIDGAVNAAWTVTATAANSTIVQTKSITSGTRWCVSAFFKKSGSTSLSFRLLFSGGTNNDLRLSVDTTDGSVSVTTDTVGDSDYAVEDYGGWWRVRAAGTDTGSNTSVSLRVRPDESTGSQSVVYDYGQLEQASTSSSPIETGSSSVTRSADIATIDGVEFSSLWNADAGTIVVEIQKTQDDTDNNNDAVSVSDGTINEAVVVGRNNVASQYQAFVRDGASTVLLESTAFTASPNRIAIALKENDAAVSFNGGTVATDSSVTLPTVDRMEIGHRGSSDHFNGHIAALYYYPKRLPNYLLEGLSQITALETAGFSIPVNKPGQQHWHSGNLEYDTQTVSLGGDFGTGAGSEVKCVRVGDQVTITLLGNLTHASSAAPDSAASPIPSKYRPLHTQINFFHEDLESLGRPKALIRITTAGKVEIRYSAATTNAPGATSITYNV